MIRLIVMLLLTGVSMALAAGGEYKASAVVLGTAGVLAVWLMFRPGNLD